MRCVQRQAAGVRVQISASRVNTSAGEKPVSRPVTCITGKHTCGLVHTAAKNVLAVLETFLYMNVTHYKTDSSKAQS